MYVPTNSVLILRSAAKRRVSKDGHTLGVAQKKLRTRWNPTLFYLASLLAAGPALMKRTERRAGGKAGPEIRPAAPGPEAGNRNRPVERREAQRPGGGLRNPVTAGRARLGAGLANPLMRRVGSLIAKGVLRAP